MKCEKCSKDHDGEYGSGRFCSGYCARSFAGDAKRLETAKKISDKLKGKPSKFKGKTAEEIYGSLERAREVIAKQQAAVNESNLERFGNPFEGTDSGAAKKALLEESSGCYCCGNGSWLGEQIPLELHHKDGNNQNNSRGNLELLCPNCHALTDTYRGRNKKTAVKISDEELVNAIRKFELNIRQALLSVGLSARGNNYSRCNRLIKTHRLDNPVSS